MGFRPMPNDHSANLNGLRCSDVSFGNPRLKRLPRDADCRRYFSSRVGSRCHRLVCTIIVYRLSSKQRDMCVIQALIVLSLGVLIGPSRVRTEFRLRPPEIIHGSLIASSRPTLLCNPVGFRTTFRRLLVIGKNLLAPSQEF